MPTLLKHKYHLKNRRIKEDCGNETKSCSGWGMEYFKMVVRGYAKDAGEMKRLGE